MAVLMAIHMEKTNKKAKKREIWPQNAKLCVDLLKLMHSATVTKFCSYLYVCRIAEFQHVWYFHNNHGNWYQVSHTLVLSNFIQVQLDT